MYLTDPTVFSDLTPIKMHSSTTKNPISVGQALEHCKGSVTKIVHMTCEQGCHKGLTYSIGGFICCSRRLILLKLQQSSRVQVVEIMW